METYDYDMDIVAMSKQELAQMYAPDLTPHAAVNRLMTWIHHHPTLTEELHRTGYRKTARVFTPRQVHLIVDYLGEP